MSNTLRCGPILHPISCLECEYFWVVNVIMIYLPELLTKRIACNLLKMFFYNHGSLCIWYHLQSQTHLTHFVIYFANGDSRQFPTRHQVYDSSLWTCNTRYCGHILHDDLITGGVSCWRLNVLWLQIIRPKTTTALFIWYRHVGNNAGCPYICLSYKVALFETLQAVV